MTRSVLQRLALLLPLAALSAAPLEKLGFDPQKEPEKAAAAYFSPESLILFRMRYPDGTYREFMRNFDTPDVLRSIGGWRARINGDRITVKTGPNVAGGQASFVFEKGRLVEFAQGELKKTFPYGSRITYVFFSNRFHGHACLIILPEITPFVGWKKRKRESLPR